MFNGPPRAEVGTVTIVLPTRVTSSDRVLAPDRTVARRLVLDLQADTAHIASRRPLGSGTTATQLRGVGRRGRNRGSLIALTQLALAFQTTRPPRSRGGMSGAGPSHERRGWAHSSLTELGTRDTRASRRPLAHGSMRASATGDGRGAASTHSVALSRQRSQLGGRFLALADMILAWARTISSSVHPSRRPVARTTSTRSLPASQASSTGDVDGSTAGPPGSRYGRETVPPPPRGERAIAVTDVSQLSVPSLPHRRRNHQGHQCPEPRRISPPT